MVKKLTISIPDDLHRKLDSYRDRIPISSVCANGLRAAIGEIEDCVSKARKRFCLLSLNEACEIAYQRGIRWAGHEASPEELAFISLFTMGKEFEGSLLEKLADVNHELRRIVDDYWENLSSFIRELEEVDDLYAPFIKDDSVRYDILWAFRDGVDAIWNEIQDELVPKMLNPDEEE